ncbi:hypothetical protein D3C81_2340430 [compost metagenome]
MTSLIEKSFRWIVKYKDGSWTYNNFVNINDVYLWEKRIGNIDKLDEIIPNPLYDEIKQPKWED